MPFSKGEVAARLRRLVDVSDSDAIAAAAERVRVDPAALRQAIDELDPHPTFEVMLAVIRAYGIDPVWLLTGDYDAAAHRQALEDDTSIARMLSEVLTPPLDISPTSAALRAQAIASEQLPDSPPLPDGPASA